MFFCVWRHGAGQNYPTNLTQGAWWSAWLLSAIFCHRQLGNHGSEVHPVCVRLADRHWDVRTVHYWRHC